jgi:intein-encoded DNA endonuclease-like protein
MSDFKNKELAVFIEKNKPELKDIIFKYGMDVKTAQSHILILLINKKENSFSYSTYPDYLFDKNIIKNENK